MRNNVHSLEWRLPSSKASLDSKRRGTLGQLIGAFIDFDLWLSGQPKQVNDKRLRLNIMPPYLCSLPFHVAFVSFSRSYTRADSLSLDIACLQTDAAVGYD